MWDAAPALRVSSEDREWLEALIRSGQTPQRVALRARLVLGAAAGRANHALAQELGISRPTVLLWRQRYVEAGVAGLLKDAPRPGRKKRIRADKVEAIVNATLHTTPADGDALERAHAGETPTGKSGHGASDLAGPQSPAPSRRDVQAQP